MKTNIFVVCIVMLFSSSCLAEDWYVDGGLGFVSFDDGVDEISPTNIYIRAGYIINPNFNVGIEASVTADSDQLAWAPGVDFDVDVGTIYVRAGAPVGENNMVYAQIGSSNTTLTASAGGLSISGDDRDMMMGFGADIGLGDDSLYLAINYSIYNNNDGVDVTGFNLGIGARF
ncbi:MAG: porin family protein [Gammaproteobacteria bacterium]|nr:porin family protein [Gammaproteobacteria bacterium]